MHDEPAWQVSNGAAVRQQDTVVSFEDRQVLLGHKSASVMIDYSAVEIERLIAQANNATVGDQRSPPTLTVHA